MDSGSLSVSKKAAAITMTFTNVLSFMALLSPFLLSFFMIMLSIVNNTIVKGLLFITGLVIVSFLTYLIKSILKERQNPLASPLCNILPFPFTSRGSIASEYVIFSSPITSSVLLGYISSYLIYPMYINNEVNYPLLMFLVSIFGTNSVIELWNKCGSIGGVVLGGILGITFGILYYGIIVASGNKELAYFTEIKSSAEGCRKPSKQRFKCSVYENGQLLKS